MSEVSRQILPVALVSVDESIPVTLQASDIDIGIVDQGLPGAIGQGWYTRITDGSTVVGLTGTAMTWVANFGGYEK